jgi:heme exporter protein C
MVMVFAFWMYSIAIALYRCRTLILQRDRHTDWVKALKR